MSMREPGLEPSNTESAALATTRAGLRRALLGPEGMAGSSGTFPRSKVMRLLVDPRHRWLRLTATAAGALLLRRYVPVRRAGVVLAGLKAAQRLLHFRRR